MELGREMIDVGASQAFAMADHQVAHIYVKNTDRLDEIRGLLAGTPGIESVWGPEELHANGLDNPRSGELVAVAEPVVDSRAEIPHGIPCRKSK